MDFCLEKVGTQYLAKSSIWHSSQYTNAEQKNKNKGKRTSNGSSVWVLQAGFDSLVIK